MVADVNLTVGASSEAVCEISHSTLTLHYLGLEHDCVTEGPADQGIQILYNRVPDRQTKRRGSIFGADCGSWVEPFHRLARVQDRFL